MPALTAHYYFGQKVLKLLPKELQSVIEKNKTAFDFGLQGPDFLFFYKPYKKNKVSGMGKKIHGEPASLIISNAIDKIKETPRQQALVYLLGFACHFVLDSSVHGEIFQITANGVEHNLLEAEIDRQVIEKYYSREPEKFKRHNLIKIDTESFEWMQNIYPELSVKLLKKCARGFVFYIWLLYSKGNAKKKLFTFAEKALCREGEFTSMMIGGQKDETYYQTAKDVCKQIEGITAAGAEAVVNIYSCIKENGILLELFEKNFI
jgi:hypothetical protein